MKSEKITKLDEKIKIQKAKLNFLEKITRMIKKNATGFDIAYEIEKDKKILRKLKLYSASKIKRFKRIGMSKFSDAKVADRINYRVIMDYLRQKNNEIKKEIEYLEYKKTKPELKGAYELLRLSMELGKSIEHLDKKFREWKN